MSNTGSSLPGCFSTQQLWHWIARATWYWYLQLGFLFDFTQSPNLTGIWAKARILNVICSGLNGKIYVKFYNKVGEGVIVLIRAGFSPNNWFWPSSIGLRGFLWRIHSSSCITTSICFIYRAERWASINLVFAVTNMVLRGIKMGLSAPVADQPYVLNIFLRDPRWPCCILYSWHASEKGACAEEGWGDARG